MGKKFGINRMGKFFDEMDFSIEKEMTREFMEGDLNQTVVLFQIDKIKSQTDDVYGETEPSELRFKTPMEINVRLTLEDGENKSYSDGYLRLKDFGMLTFDVFVDHLDELGVNINYGDYIGYALNETTIKYFTVVDDGQIYDNTSNTIMGYKGYFRKIKCTPADINEFNPRY